MPAAGARGERPISYNYYDEDEFWTIWNRPNYLAVKRLTDPNDVFRDLYTKTCRVTKTCRAARGLDDAPRAGRPPEETQP